MKNGFALLVVLAASSAAPARAWEREKTVLADFESGKAEDRIRLAPTLGRIGNKKAVDALLAAFDIRSPNSTEPTAELDALGRAGDPRAVPEIAEADETLRSMSLQGELPERFQLLRVKILEALGRLGGDRAVSILEEAVNDGDPRVVEEAVRGLGLLQVKDAVPALQRLALQGGDMTRAVFEAFASIGDKRADAALEQGLTGEDRLIRVEAAYALARHGRKGMIERLEAFLKNDPGDPASAKAGLLAASYLAKMDRSSGLDYLVALLGKPDSGFSVLAADALGKSENPRAVLPLVEAMKSDDPSLRLSVARGLGLLGGTRALSALKKLRSDPNPGVRDAALVSLAELGEAD